MKTYTPALLLILSLTTTGCQADDDDHRDYGEARHFLKRTPGVAPVSHPLYKEECGGCHLAYPPGLLPGSAWRKIMAGLEQHFGDNAELDTSVRNELTDYLLLNSADKANYRRSRRIMRSIDADNPPLRITELPYFTHEHDEIPGRLIKANDKVRSLSNCNACHRRAEQGSFREREINIPGYGHWDD